MTTINELLRNKKKVIKRFERVKERIMEEKENEEVWPGHENTRYHADENEYQVLLSHLEEIEKELEKLKKK